MSHRTGRGHLKIYLGYAPGIGKTSQMLQEAAELKAGGVDVVIGFLEIAGQTGIAALAEGFEAIPVRKISIPAGAGDIDIPTVIKRAPDACIVDQLAHSTPGGGRAKRWEDVLVLVEAGIDVLTTMNVQQLASLADQVWQITGTHIRETVPDWVFQQADEVVMVDLTPRALLNRLQRGAIHSRLAGEDAEAVFREPTLVALRELAIRQTAQALEARSGLGNPGGEQNGEQREKILVNVTAHPSTAVLLRRARRMADYLGADCVAVHVHSQTSFNNLPQIERQPIERHLRFARTLQIETHLIHGRNRPRTLVDFAREHGCTQIFLRGDDTGDSRGFGRDFAARVIDQARDLEVIAIADPSRNGRMPSAYPEDEACGLMHSSYIRLAPDFTAEEAVSEIRLRAADVEMIFYAYVVDESQHLLGVVSFRELLTAQRGRKVIGIARRDFASVGEKTDKEVVAQLLSSRGLLAVPVLDAAGRMLGIVTSTDVAGAVQQAAGEDIQKIGGMEALDGPYLQVTFLQMVKKRAGWLAVLFLGEMLTATAMGYFETEISRAVVLALFLPLIISSGGNSGSQATTLVIRAMALGEVGLRDWWRVIRRELGAGLALGAILGVIGISRILLWQSVRGSYGPHYLAVALTIGVSLVGVVLFGSVAGSMLPFVLRRCGLDPASASAPFVATLVDVTGLIIYFTVASVILRGTLL